MKVGAIAAGASAETVAAFARFALPLAVASQIRDEVLKLGRIEQVYGEEATGDIWQGRRTLPMLYLLRRADKYEKVEVLRIMSKSPPQQDAVESMGLVPVLDHLVEEDFHFLVPVI